MREREQYIDWLSTHGVEYRLTPRDTFSQEEKLLQGMSIDQTQSGSNESQYHEMDTSLVK